MQCVYEPRPQQKFALWCFKHGIVIKIYKGRMLNFYLRLPQMVVSSHGREPGNETSYKVGTVSIQWTTT